MTSPESGSQAIHPLSPPASWPAKLTAMTAMAIGIAHDINSYLTVIRGNNTIIQRSLPAGTRAIENSRMLDEAAVEAVDLAHALFVFSGHGMSDVEDVNLTSLIQQIESTIRARIQPPNRVCFVTDSPAPTVRGDPAMITKAILNLVENAAEALLCEAGTVTVTVGFKDCTSADLAASYQDAQPLAGGYSFIEISDTGHGIAPAVHERMFDPFFTTKIRARGMGLPFALGVARSHRGAILISSAPGIGTSARLYLPSRINEP
jgi:signal transduction histidine kinase